MDNLVIVMTNALIFASSVVVVAKILKSKEKTPYHDSILTGRLYYEEIMTTNNKNRFMDVARMDDRGVAEAVLVFLCQSNCVVAAVGADERDERHHLLF